MNGAGAYTDYLPEIFHLSTALTGPIPTGNVTQFGAFDLNSRSPIPGIQVNAYGDNMTQLGVCYTQPNGFCFIDASNGTNVSFMAAGVGYLTFSGNFTQYLPTVTFAMTPISIDAITRVRFQDIGLFAHKEICIYFQENGRLKGCYPTNDTVTLLVNKNYTIVPIITTGDLVSTPGNIKRWIFMFVPYMFMFAILLALATITYYVIFKRRRKR
jgi:hypothetical protein